MRILWITNTLFPEAERLLTGKGELRTTGGWMIGAAEALMSYNNTQLAVATVSTFVKSLQVLRGHKIIYYVFPLGKGNFKYNPEYEKYWRKIKDDYRPDIVHIHGTEFTHGLSYIKTCGNHNAVVSIQGLKSLYANYYRGDISLIDIIKTSTLRDFVKGGIVSGQHRFRQAGKYELEMLKSVEHIIGRTSWDKSFVWANCPNATYHFCNETLRSEFYSGMRWSEEKCERHTIFVSQGTYPIKGLHKLLDAMPIILSYYPDAKVRIAGNDLTKPRKVKGISVLDGYGNYIKKKITRLKLSTSVDFVGNLNAEEMIKEYLNANVFVSPSAIENSPNSLGEAQILGVPCISSYVGGAPDMMIGNEQNLYRYEETNMLANKICSIFQNADKEKLDLMQKIAAERHSKTNNAEETMKIYVGIVNKCKWGGGAVAKALWRQYARIRIRKANVKISRNVSFNKNTSFEGNNRIGAKCKIGNTNIGHFSYMGSNCNLSNCKIGRFSSIGSFVEVIPWTHPSNTYVSTSPVFFSDKMQTGISFCKKSIFDERLSIEGYDTIIGNDVWIGNHVLIKGGVKIGDGAIVAFGSAVTRDVPPYAIVGGVPAKIIRYRFCEQEIHKLRNLQWWNKDIKWLKNNVSKFADIANINSL